ncbi:MAG TPA: thioredoxin family protein [Candidatus Dormibacteraeota bacterium]|nr:thioredoxin family protein [Candidatus Dormibacteraeota bacterium]
MAIRPLAAALLIVGLLGGPALAGPKVSVALINEAASIEPGAPLWVGLRQRIAPGWHTYWLNPGDSGEPPTIEWRLSPGWEAGPLVWPRPERIPVGPVMSYGYSDEVVLLTRLTAPASLTPGTPITLRGHASWLVCEKICIPEEADVALTLPVIAAKAGDGPGAAAVEHARRAVPSPSPWPVSLEATTETVTLQVAAPGLVADRIAEVWFFPSRWGVIDHAAPQMVTVGERGITLQTARGQLGAAVDTPVDGVLVVRERLDQGTVSQAFAIQMAPAGRHVAGAGPDLSLLAALGLGLAGGLILNLMPCVLPVLSIKALALVSHADASRSVMRRHGVAYAVGVLTSFAALAGALIALRAGGAQTGWGFQLQSPAVVIVLAYVLFALALSLSGLLAIGGRLAGVGHGLAQRPGYVGSFFTGALATVAATPCTAPFMGVAMGYALTRPPLTGLLVFEAVGLGLALPYLVLSFTPAWRRWLPGPGPWMIRLRQALAFPLYASVAWLVWVVGRQAGPDGVALVLAGLLLIAFAAWLHHGSRDAAPRWRRAAVVIALASVAAAIALGPLGAAGPWAAPSRPDLGLGGAPAGARWEPWSPRRLAELQSQGKPVFVNFTAAWCITCLVNERVALHSPAVAEAFARKGVVYLKADWTSQSPEIATVLGSFGRSGVPLYVVYPARRGAAVAAEPRVLPQILSESTLIEAVDKI